MTQYSAKGDLLLGDLPLPAYVDVDKIIRDVADEIDSHVGFVYQTPFDLSDDSLLSRPSRLLIKRISVHLSTGRIILSVATTGEQNDTHAWGRRLVSDAMAALAAIRNGTFFLEGATLLPQANVEVTTPLIFNEDARSQVEAFYGALENPTYRVTGLPL